MRNTFFHNAIGAFGMVLCSISWTVDQHGRYTSSSYKFLARRSRATAIIASHQMTYEHELRKRKP